MATSTQVKRLHIGGLTPNITPEHLESRFKIFGQVDGVETLGPDGLGEPRKFAYVTLRTSASELKRCLNTLSGSMYRGAQLRIAEAKPRATDRITKENNPTPEQVERAKVQKRKRVQRTAGPGVGKEAQDMGVVTMDNYKTRSKFWNETPTHHLIRPLALRPTHSLPPPLASSTTVPTPSRTRLPPKRQRMRVINPFLWGPTHVGEAVLLGGQPFEPMTTGEEWVFEEGEEETDDDRVIIGRWVRRDGSDEQIVRVKRQRVGMEANESVEDDESDDGLFATRVGDDGRASSPLFGSRRLLDEQSEASGGSSPLFAATRGSVSKEAGDLESDTQRESSPLFPSTSRIPRGSSAWGSDSDSYRSPSPLFPTHPEPPADSNDDASHTPSSESSAPTDQASSTRSASPLFSTRPGPTGISEKSSTQAKPLPNETKPLAISDDLIQVARQERLRSLKLFTSLVETTDAVPVIAKPVKSEWGGFDESDSEEDDDFYARLKEEAKVKAEALKAEAGVGGDTGERPLRLRGGGVAVEEDADSDTSGDSSDDDSSASSSGSSSSTTSSDSDSDSDSDSGSDESSSSSLASSSAKPAPAAPLAGLFSGSGGGFSLAAFAGDIEMADELDIPLGSAVIGTEEAELELLAPTQRELFDPSPDIPLFFIPQTSAAQAPRPGWAIHPVQRKGEVAPPIPEQEEAPSYSRIHPSRQWQNPNRPTLGQDETADFPQGQDFAHRPDAGWGSRDTGGRKKTDAAVGVVAAAVGAAVEGKGFWRPDGQTDEQMKDRWDQVRKGLTGEWKIRGREARKQRKRRGGGEDE